ncbi:hypothetical protein NLG97_g4444 [Lecanicillium saksenae]|uniref:Uncharacterized protein n=1 Tax=Lecanicillium saksenae TaxID=468837 RepID=A0ACC1QYJ7_9HYPO|nr:hypothetical protein NLG97_g4444 [Lecanicillium saksenae]
MMAAQIILDFSPRMGSALGDTVSPEAPLGHIQNGRPRQRRWASRAKTGCLTCRTRKVKCDEEKPVCRKCTSSGQTCHGVGYSSSPQSSPEKSFVRTTGRRVPVTPPTTPPKTSNAGTLQLFGSEQKQNINVETAPPRYDFHEGVRYYYEVVVPGRAAEVRSSTHPDFRASDFEHERFLSQVVGDRISRASKARGVLLRPGENTAFGPIWETYHRYLASSIERVNRCISEAKPGEIEPTLWGIDQLLVLDLYVERSVWQAHTRGFFAYINHRGGVEVLLNDPDPPFFLLKHVLSVAIYADTTSPARQQIRGYDLITDQQLGLILEYSSPTPLQCPITLSISIVHTSRLRAALTRKDNSIDKNNTAQEVKRIFDAITAFDAEEWAAQPIFTGNIRAQVLPTLGRIFALAVRLYGVLSLPQSAVVSWVVSSEKKHPEMTDAEIYDTLRLWQREELLALLRQSWDQLKSTTALSWPLIVAGVAFAGGSKEDQEFVDESLMAIWNLPNTLAGLLLTIKKLRSFWESGKTEWEDCFDKPIPFQPHLALAEVPARHFPSRCHIAPCISVTVICSLFIMDLTFIIEDPLARDNHSGSSSPEAPFGRILTGEPRQRKWAPRTRTGCITCRLRRVKCDEARPVCKRCTTARLQCQGYTQKDPAQKDPASGLRSLRPRKVTVCPEFEPFDWEFQQSLRYFYQVVVPDLPPEARVFDMGQLKGDAYAQRALRADIISDQLERACKARGRTLRPGEDPAFEASWAGYHQGVIESIDATNEFIKNDAKYTNEAPATLAILQLLLSDLKTGLNLWRAHLRGFHAYVEHRGGASKIMTLPKPEKSRLSPALSITMQTNTTCPADMQVKGSDNFSDDDIRTLIAFDSAIVEPCPADFHLARVRITRLRVDLAWGKTSSSMAGAVRKVQEIFDALWRFNLDEWVAEEFRDKGEDLKEQAQLMGPIYAVAIRLYGILTLPELAITAWASSSPDIVSAHPIIPGCSIYETIRRQHRDQLLRMLRQAWDEARLKKWLAWPLVVLGVALAHDTSRNRRFVEESLWAIWKIPYVSTASIAALEKLRIFWLAGKTGWEECFDEPVPFSI